VLSSLTPDPALTPRIHAAIDATTESDPEFWKRVCDQNDPRVTKVGGVLSIRPGYEGNIESALRTCEWSAYEVPEVIAPMAIFRTFDFAGTMGVVDLRTLSPYLLVRLLDPNRTGLSEAYIYRDRGEVVPFITMTLGPGKRETVWTFHPGPPIPPSTVPTRPAYESEITVAKALKLGLKWAKCSAP